MLLQCLYFEDVTIRRNRKAKESGEQKGCLTNTDKQVEGSHVTESLEDEVRLRKVWDVKPGSTRGERTPS